MLVALRWVRGSVIIVSLSLAMVSCTIDRVNQTDQSAETTGSVAEALLAPVVSVTNGATEVNPSQLVLVKSLDKGLSSVTMTNEEGKVIESALADDAMSWSTTETLGYNRTYTIEALDKNGEKTTTTFQTIAATATDAVALSPLPDSTVGIGQVIGFQFDYLVEDRQRIQNAIKVTTSPQVEGAFYWVSPYEVRWRPAQYWQPGTTVSVEANIFGVEITKGVYGKENNSTNFTIGDRVEAVVDDATKQMSVYKNGDLLKTMPVSLGSNQNPTPNGVYIIGDQYESLVMDSTTYGLALDAGGYRTDVKYATQMSYSGIYVHAAPWSVGSQGVANVSHGCINVTTENAKWFQDVVKRGDIVTVQNTIGGVLSGVDGLGDWNIDWETWKAGNTSF
ncbi:ErfK/YbiS/YcfS/YnhG family lipoprotein [Corynebacterium kutscheri]|uniref:ErfK/YbiS/YcfS/YnhG family lipoprotein n=1 Tax=Corynebacterium kutscheri TaxID=35755 RepID=A0A0F6R187_9CORY|nr:Ig-like domain-containing protein [Corynebacterium kutscheri]AKE40858.1 hypothetical protein UL82_03225 [Corynebacterium kutscheri]VEH06598.1 ErfK/YbiS/YcfS/YnhG family lipoprotein [Corynebacterium kutscheri]VEH09155.1 ErfK/YbiS/YcfS/YnhG family lipoprotein [Corynebacterium kutscheri]VEH82528.1 ErfK/YbiS/YcfS/YnhG family lipoprotein [Corynebacterium kutscheri]